MKNINVDEKTLCALNFLSYNMAIKDSFGMHITEGSYVKN